MTTNVNNPTDVNQTNIDDTADIHIDNFGEWYASVGRTVEEQGFINAWKQHFKEIIYVHHSDRFLDTLLGESLYALMMKDPSLNEYFENLPKEQARQLESYLKQEEPKPSQWDSQKHRDFIKGVCYQLVQQQAEPFQEIKEADGSPMKCLRQKTFRNWGRTVENTPFLTCIPKTKVGVCNLVKWAVVNKKTVRVAGYRHTWGGLYSANDQVLISLLPLNVTEDLPAQHPGIDLDNQLQGIQIVGQIREDGVTKALCKIGAATTNEQFRRWSLNEQGGNWNWTIPLNVVMVEITWGGSNGPICHGAGRRHQTLSDLVVEIEFVNAKGELQVVKDSEQLKAAAGCFGLLGIVTSLTLKLDPMSYAVLKPVKPRLALTIPPPKGFDIPSDIDMRGITEQELEKAWKAFVDRCENDYYAEWFWFPYQQKCWVNTWKNNGKREEAQLYPGDWGTWIEQVQSYIAELLNNSLFKCLPGKTQANMLAIASMLVLPEKKTIVTPLIEALHFRRGIQNMRVLCMELEIPIPPRKDDLSRPDWTVCQKAWWAAISKVYKHKDAPMRIALEMRIMADSNITMAPQFGNRFGTCSIEVVTTLNVSRNEWLAFMQELTDEWDSYTDSDGNRLNVRPHWAKQWEGLAFRGMTVNEYLKEVAYKERIPEFKAGLQTIAKAGGYTFADLNRVFSNPLLNDIFK